MLITARRGEWPEDFVKQTYRLDVFKEEESLEFLRKYLPDEVKYPEAELKELAERLGHLPLALELAGRYLKRMKIKVAEYLNKLDTVMEHPSMQNWKPEYGNPTDHDLSPQGTFLLSWESVNVEAARQVFRLISWCAPLEPVPRALLGVAAELDEEALASTLIELEDVGLVINLKHVDEPLVHPLIGEFGQIVSREVGEDKDLDLVSHALARIATTANETGLPSNYAPLKRHVENVARNAEAANLISASSLYENQGYHFREIAEYSEARQMFERALQITENVLGPEHLDLGFTVSNLGNLLEAVGDYDGARRLYEQALIIFEKHLGSEHPSVGTAVNNLGSVLQDMGDYNGARRMYERALIITEKNMGSVHPHVGKALNNLGSVLWEMGDNRGAKQLFERALTITENALGSEHPEVGKTLNNLGTVLQDLGDLDGARQMYERALAIAEQVYGPEHPEVSGPLNNLGTVLQDLGDLDGARQMYERALAIDEDALGAYHPNVGLDFNNLGGY